LGSCPLPRVKATFLLFYHHHPSFSNMSSSRKIKDNIAALRAQLAAAKQLKEQQERKECKQKEHKEYEQKECEERKQRKREQRACKEEEQKICKEEERRQQEREEREMRKWKERQQHAHKEAWAQYKHECKKCICQMQGAPEESNGEVCGSPALKCRRVVRSTEAAGSEAREVPVRSYCLLAVHD
jgi:hypothetical protein